MTQRQVTIALLVTQIVVGLMIAIGQAMRDARDPALPISLVGTVLGIGLLIAFRYGWTAAVPINIVMVTVAIGLGTPDKIVRETPGIHILVPPAVAQVLAGPSWIAGSALGVLAIFSMRAGPEARFLTNYTSDLRTLGIFVGLVAAMVLSRLIADRALRDAVAHSVQAEEALACANKHAEELKAQAQALLEQNERQRRLLDLVARLETPAVMLAEGVLLAPIVGPIDAQRAETLVPRLLQHASDHRARLVVLDVAGASNVDANAAQALGRAVEALRLIGCRVAISGISAATAHVLATNNVSFNGAPTVRTPREALERELAA